MAIKKKGGSDNADIKLSMEVVGNFNTEESINNISSAFDIALKRSLSSLIKTFSTALGSQLKIVVDSEFAKALKSPIHLIINTDQAEKNVDALSARIRGAARDFGKISAAVSGSSTPQPTPTIVKDRDTTSDYQIQLQSLNRAEKLLKEATPRYERTLKNLEAKKEELTTELKKKEKNRNKDLINQLTRDINVLEKTFEHESIVYKNRQTRVEIEKGNLLRLARNPDEVTFEELHKKSLSAVAGKLPKKAEEIRSNTLESLHNLRKEEARLGRLFLRIEDKPQLESLMDSAVHKTDKIDKTVEKIISRAENAEFSKSGADKLKDAVKKTREVADHLEESVRIFNQGEETILGERALKYKELGARIKEITESLKKAGVNEAEIKDIVGGASNEFDRLTTKFFQLSDEMERAQPDLKSVKKLVDDIVKDLPKLESSTITLEEKRGKVGEKIDTAMANSEDRKKESAIVRENIEISRQAYREVAQRMEQDKAFSGLRKQFLSEINELEKERINILSSAPDEGGAMTKKQIDDLNKITRSIDALIKKRKEEYSTVEKGKALLNGDEYNELTNEIGRARNVLNTRIKSEKEVDGVLSKSTTSIKLYQNQMYNLRSELNKAEPDLKKIIDLINSLGNLKEKIKLDTGSIIGNEGGRLDLIEGESIENRRKKIEPFKSGIYGKIISSDLNQAINPQQLNKRFGEISKDIRDLIGELSNQFVALETATDVEATHINSVINNLVSLIKRKTGIYKKEFTTFTSAVKTVNERLDPEFLAHLNSYEEAAGRHLAKLGYNEKQVNELTASLRSSIIKFGDMMALLRQETKEPYPSEDKLIADMKSADAAYDLIRSRANNIITDMTGPTRFVDRNQDKQEQRLSQLKEERVNLEYIDKLEGQLLKKRIEVQKAGPEGSAVPLNYVNKVTQVYDKTILAIRRQKESLDTQFKEGRPIDEVVKGYESLNRQIIELGHGIEQIDVKKLKSAFFLEESDPRKMIFNLGILAFTLGMVGRQLLNFSRNAIMTFTRLAQFAEPIERVSNSLDKQVKDGLILSSERIKAMEELRDIGDLPGSSVESANKTFEQLKRINISLQERLNLTRGLSKLPAITGGGPEDANQLANALAKASARGSFEGDNFKTLLAQGGPIMDKLLKRLGIIGTADSVNKYGVNNFIRELIRELENVESPALTTSDRMNHLKSRLSELGVIVGDIVAPALESLNEVLKNLNNTFGKLREKYDLLPSIIKKLIGIIIISIPILTGFIGALLIVLATIGSSGSGFKMAQAHISGFFELFGIKSKKIVVDSIIASRAIDSVTASAVRLNKTSITAPIFSKSIGKSINQSEYTKIGIIKKTESALKPIDTKAAASSFGKGAAITAGSVVISPTKAAELTTLNAANKEFGKTVTIFGKISSMFGTVLSFFGRIGTFIRGFIPAFSSVLLIVGAIIAIFTSYFTNFNKIQDKISNAFLKIDESLKGIFKRADIDLGDNSAISYSLNKIVYVLKEIGMFILYILELVGDLVSTVGNILLNAFIAVLDVIKEFLNTFSELYDSFKKGNIFKAFIIGATGLLKLLGVFVKSFLVNTVSDIILLISEFAEKTLPIIGGSFARTLRGASDYVLKKGGEDLTQYYEKQKREKENNERIQSEKEVQDRLKQMEDDYIKQRSSTIAEMYDSLKELEKNFFKEERKSRNEAFKMYVETISDNAKRAGELFVKNLELAINPDRILGLYGRNLNTIKETYTNTIEEIKMTSDDNILELISEFLKDSMVEKFKGIIKNAPSIKPVEIGQIYVNLSNAIKDLEGATTREDSINKLKIFYKRYNELIKSGDITQSEMEAIRAFSLRMRKLNRDIESNNRKANNEIRKKGNDVRAEIDAANDRVINRITQLKAEGLEFNRKLEDDIKSAQDEINKINNEIDSTDHISRYYSKMGTLFKQNIVDQHEQYLRFERQRVELLRKREDIIQKYAAEESKVVSSLLYENKEDREETLNIIKEARDNELSRLDTNLSTLNKIQTDLFMASQKLFSYKLKDVIYEFYDNIKESLDSILKIPQEITNRILKSLSISAAYNNVSDISSLLKKLIGEKIINNKIDIGNYINKPIEEKLNELLTDSVTDELKEKVDKFNTIMSQLRIEDNIILYDKYELAPPTDFNIENARKEISNNLYRGIFKDPMNNNKLLDIMNNKISDYERNKLKTIYDIESRNFIETLLDVKNRSTPYKFDQFLEEYVTSRLREVKYKINPDTGKEMIDQITGKPIIEDMYYIDPKKFALVIERIKDYLKLYEISVQYVQDKEEKINDGITKILEALSKANDEKYEKDIEKKTNELGDVEDKIIRTTNKKELAELEAHHRNLIIELAKYEFERQAIKIESDAEINKIEVSYNEDEIKRIDENTKDKIKALRRQSSKLLLEKIGETNFKVDKNGNILDSNGNTIKFDIPNTITANDIRTGIKSGNIDRNGPDVNIDLLKNTENVIDRIIKSLIGINQEAVKAGDAILDFFDKIASGALTISSFKNLIFSTNFDLKDLTLAFKNLATFGIMAFTNALSKSIVSIFTEGGNFLKQLGKFFGEMLIQLGTTLVQLGITAIALSVLSKIPFFKGIVPNSQVSATGGAVALAAGIGLIAAGKAMGGANVSNAGTTNNAMSNAGATGAGYNPSEDPKLMYQKALRTEIYLDIRSDDSQIIKSIVKQTNRDPRLNNLIANRSLNFSL